MKFKHVLTPVSALALCLGGSAAMAGTPISSLLFPQFLLEDNYFESINIDNNGNGLLETGDSLRGMISIQTISELPSGGSNNLSSANGTNSFTAIFETEVLTRTFQVNLADGAGDRYAYTFGPVGGIGGAGLSIPGVTLPTGAMVAFFEDANFDFSGDQPCTVNSSAVGGCERPVVYDDVVAGTFADLQLVYGMAGTDGDAGWQSSLTPENTTLPENFPNSSGLGTFNYQLEILENNLGIDLVDVPVDPAVPINGGAPVDGLIGMTGGGVVKGTSNLATNYSVSGDNDIIGASSVPEPASLAIFGAGLLGVAGAARRKRKSQES